MKSVTLFSTLLDSIFPRVVGVRGVLGVFGVRGARDWERVDFVDGTGSSDEDLMGPVLWIDFRRWVSGREGERWRVLR